MNNVYFPSFKNTLVCSYFIKQSLCVLDFKLVLVSWTTLGPSQAIDTILCFCFVLYEIRVITKSEMRQTKCIFSRYSSMSQTLSTVPNKLSTRHCSSSIQLKYWSLDVNKQSRNQMSLQLIGTMYCDYRYCLLLVLDTS